MMFSYETIEAIAGWCFILFCIHLLLFCGWGLYGDEKNHEFYRKHRRDIRDDEVSKPWIYFGAYILASLIFYPICGFYFMGRNCDENIRRKEARYQEIYQQGMTAAENGIPDSACPFRKSGGKYATSSPDERKWLEGWTAKKIQMNKEQKP
jgi:hypothetical protein